MSQPAPASVLIGSVRSHDGWPVPDAGVTVLDAHGSQAGRAVTDETGAFEAALGASGPLTVVVTAAGCDPVAVPTHAAPGRRTRLAPVMVAGAAALALPAPGVWQIDPAHSIVRATARHIGLSRIEGRFTAFTGEIVVADPVEESSCRLDVEAASITTGTDARDDHLRSPDFLDVQRFPLLSYRSTGVQRHTDEAWTVDGVLTIRDIRHVVPLKVRYLGTGPDAWGGTRAAFEGRTQLARKDYEMRWNMGLPGGLTLVGPTLRIDLDVQAVRVPPESGPAHGGTGWA